MTNSYRGASFHGKAGLPMRTPMEVIHPDGSRTLVRIVKKHTQQGNEEVIFEAEDGSLFVPRPGGGLGVVPYNGGAA